MQTVFISHSWCDKPLARKIADTLRKFAIHVWLDEAEIKLGDSLIDKIRQGIDSVQYVIALLSKDAVASEWVKKELDIAMNQEIEGKRVKVLPILAASCALPGFLKGKLYADMSTPKAFKKALPMLLDRVGVSGDMLKAISGGASLDKVTKTSSQALDLSHGLLSADPVLQYTTLKSLKSWEHKEVLLYPGVLDGVCSLLRPECPTHIRLEALRVIGFLEDANFADKVESLLNDQNHVILDHAIQALGKLKATGSGLRLLKLFRESQDLRIRVACLNFFSTLALEDDVDAMSVVAAAEEFLSQQPSDPGTELRVTRVLCKQWGGNRDEVLDRLLKYLDSPNVETRSEILSTVKDYAGGEELWNRHPECKNRLREALRQSMKQGTASEKALVWLAGFFWHESDRQEVWRYILSGSSDAIETFFFELEVEGYFLDRLFDQPEDVEALIQLAAKLKGEGQTKILEVIAEVPSEKALAALVAHKYKPSGWKAVHVLKSFATIKKWNKALNKLLKAALLNCPEKDGTAIALGLIARYYAGEVDLDTLLTEFPREDVAGFQFRKHEVSRFLETLKEDASARQKRRLSSMIQSINHDEDDDD